MQPDDTNEDFLNLTALVTDNVPAMLAYWDNDLTCRFANAAYLSRLGKTREEIIGSSIKSLLPEPVYEQHKFYIAGALAGKAQHFEYAVLVPDSSDMRHEQVSFYPDMANGVKGFVAHVTDITQQKAQKQQTEASNNMISNQNKSLLDFANIVSHNFKSYANNLESLLGMYESEPDKDERERIFNFLKEMSVDFKSSIENLKDIVKVQNLGKVPMEQVNLHSYVVKATDVLPAELEATKAVIHNNIDPAIHIEANAAYVESILLNFIDNAIKYRHPDRNPEIELSTVEVGNETVLNIKDNGLGMDLDRYRDKLYGMYNTFHGNQNATGLGLFMVKQQVDNMGGYIGVESSVGMGTWFRVYFKTKAVSV